MGSLLNASKYLGKKITAVLCHLFEKTEQKQIFSSFPVRLGNPADYPDTKPRQRCYMARI